MVLDLRSVAGATSFDVLVIGSGASGLAAGVSALRAGARVAVATKTSLQANNSSKAQGGIQASFSPDDSPELHAEDMMRSSHETADPALVATLTGERASAIHWLEDPGVEFTRSNGAYGSRAARCDAAASPAGRYRTGHAITKALRERIRAGSVRNCSTTISAETLAALGDGWAVASFDTKAGLRRVEAGTVVLAAGGAVSR